MVPRETPGVRAQDMGESLGVRGTDHALLTFERAPVPVANRLGAGGRRARGRLRRLSHAQPDRRREHLRRAGAPRPRAGRRARARAGDLRQAARRSARRSPSRSPRTPPTSKPRASSPCTRPGAGRAGAAEAADLSSMAKLTAVDMLDPGHRQGAADPRRRRLLGLAADRAGLPRRARPALRGGHERDPEDDHRARGPRPGPRAVAERGPADGRP